MKGAALIVARDLLVRTRLEEAARGAGLAVETRSSPGAVPDEAPSVLVVAADGPDVLHELEPWRARWPSLRVIAVLFHVDEAVRNAAEALGCEVLTRGELAARGPEVFA